MGRIRLLLQSSRQVRQDLPGDLAEGISAETGHHGSGQRLQQLRISQDGLDHGSSSGIGGSGLTLGGRHLTRGGIRSGFWRGGGGCLGFSSFDSGLSRQDHRGRLFQLPDQGHQVVQVSDGFLGLRFRRWSHWRRLGQVPFQNLQVQLLQVGSG